ncbi:MAG: PilN domain-containing protein [Phycisphaeraceae bacterium]|nr:PilN domain-containing protein [Phycisphaeraceae bacterium]
MWKPFVRPDQQGASFLPQDYVARKAEMRANLICLGLFGVVMFGVIAAFFVTNRQWLHVRRSQQAITAQFSQEAIKIEQLKQLEKQKNEMMEKAEITTALVERVPRSILMAELITRMPDDITLLELTLVSKRIKDTPPPKEATKTTTSPQIKTLSSAAKPGTGKSVEPPKPEKVTPPRFEYTLKLVGVARVNNNIADYIQALKNCPLLENTDLKYIKEVTIEKMDLRKFEIEASIRKDADARGMEPLKDLNARGAPGASPTRPSVLTPGTSESVRVYSNQEKE